MFNDFELNPDINIAYSGITEKLTLAAAETIPRSKINKKTKE
jgi:hypothetical protein